MFTESHPALINQHSMMRSVVARPVVVPSKHNPYVTYSLGLAFFRPTPPTPTRGISTSTFLPFPSSFSSCAALLLAAAYFGRTFIYLFRLPPSLASSSFKAPVVIDRNYFEPGCPIRWELKSVSGVWIREHSCKSN